MAGKFGTKGRDGAALDQKMVSNWVGYGIHKLFISGHEVKTAKTGSKKLVLFFETSPCTEAGFKASKDAKKGGKTAKAEASIWIKGGEDGQKFQDELMDRLALIAKHLGRTEALDAKGENADTLEDYLNEAVPALYWANEAFYLLKGVEYINAKQKIGVMNELGRYGFVKAVNAAGVPVIAKDSNGNDYIQSVPPLDNSGSETTMTFDKNSIYCYEPVTESAESADNIAEETTSGSEGESGEGGDLNWD